MRVDRPIRHRGNRKGALALAGLPVRTGGPVGEVARELYEILEIGYRKGSREGVFVGVKIREVAARAEVSVATASRALSGQRGVRPDNRRLVLAAARELGYRPDVVAAALRGGTTRTVGMVVPRISNPFFATLVEAVARQLQDDRRSLLLANSHYEPTVEQRETDALLDRRVDALIAVPCHRQHSRDTINDAATRVPTVQLDLRVDDDVGSWVGVDNEAGISRVLTHLIDAGARRLAYIGSYPTDSAAQERMDGYQRVAGRHLGTPGTVLLGDFSKEWGQRAAERLLAEQALPDAIVCGNDMIALGVLSVLTSRGIRVPDDVRVTGFDDIPYATLSAPALTTVRQPQERIAAETVRVLTTNREPSAPAHRIALTPELIVRTSSSRKPGATAVPPRSPTGR